ncbi:MAG: sigma-70 family RNA polymerase sigma factor [Acidobacteriota bacterium]|nr:sigma-70 family RNA polymerase sigma factor [Acidobacteriota bacterium]
MTAGATLLSCRTRFFIFITVNMFGVGKEQEKEWAAFEAEALPLMADVFRVANYLARDRETAEDLTQETFAEALKSFHRYTPDTNCRAWLVTILYHLNSKRRYKLGQLKLVEDVEEQIAQTIAFVPPIPQHLKDEEILAALKKIPRQFSDVVVLSDVEEFSYKEIAEFTGVPIGTVMSRLHRGRKLLRQELIHYAGNFGIAAEG